MAFRLAALRHTRFAVTLLVLCFAAGVRADEAQEAKEPSSQQQPAATPPGVHGTHHEPQLPYLRRPPRR